MPAQAHYIVLIRRINLSETDVKVPRVRLFAPVWPASTGKAFFVDALCVGRESKD